MLNLFTKPFFRHITAGVLILIIALGIGWYFGSNGKAELKGELKAVNEEVDLLRQTVSHLAKQPKIKVHNQIEDVKVKDGSTLDFIPEIEIEQNNIRDPVNLEKPSPILSQETKREIVKLENHLNKLIDGNRRKRKQQKLKEEIERLRNPP